jgi:cytochrome c551/c552
MKHFITLFLSTAMLAFGVACGAAMAQPASLKPLKPLTIKLPPETASLKASPLPGYQAAMQKCGICHSADYIKLQPPAMTQPQWTAEVRKMQHAYAAPLTDKEVADIGEYLAVTYGGAKPSGTAAVVAPPAASAANMAATAVDVRALLTANACLGCHAIGQKIVGPAYHEVALKYKNDAQAQNRLETSIRSGSSGKWGTVPMPAFAALSPRELAALAAFVLEQ